MTRPNRFLRPQVLAITAGILAFALAVVTMPRPPSLAKQTSGDAALGILVQREVEKHPAMLDRLVVATVTRTDTGTETTFAGFGADNHLPFEIGSISKTVTSALFVEAIQRGEVTADTPAGELLPLSDSDAASVTLEELASHRSGLPRVETGIAAFATQLLGVYRATDPYPLDEDAVVRAAASAGLSNRGQFAYSNLGAALLGQALASAAGTDYASLVEARFSHQLGLTETTVPVVPEHLPQDALLGIAPNARTAAAWTLGSYAPAGGIRASASDLAIFASAILTESAPGMDALTPRFDDGDGGQVGYAWFTKQSGSTEVTWHNGGTGGFRSMMAIDRTGGKAVIVLSNTSTSVDELAISLLTDPNTDSGQEAAR